MQVSLIPSVAVGLTIVLLWVWAPILSGGASPGWAADRPLLIEKHKAAGLNCGACHAENPPPMAPPMLTCMNCHGKYEVIAEKTRNVTPHNPHESHQGEVECGECHHVHKASVDFCGQCHQFGFKVP